MPWLQISITTDEAHAGHAEQVMLDAGAGSITYRDAEDKPILEPAPGETPMWEHSIITGLFDSDADSERLVSELSLQLDAFRHSIRVESLADQDWERTWMDHFKPMAFGDHFWVVPTHLEPPDADAVNLRLDPGLAFGSGTHPTTALCLRWLAAHPPRQRRVLDYGCGSGILAIAALLLDAAHAVGVDIDPQAIEASAANATANEVADRLELQLPDRFEATQYELVLANILSGPLASLAPQLARCTCAGGDIVLSGLLAEQADAISAVYAEWFDMEPAVLLEDWAMLHGCRKP